MIARRSVAETMELEMSLRQSRGIYTFSALVGFPGAIYSAFAAFVKLEEIASLIDADESIDKIIFSAAWVLIYVGLIYLEYVFIQQRKEAGRRLALLHDDPTAKVRKMITIFEDRDFGRY